MGIFGLLSCFGPICLEGRLCKSNVVGWLGGYPGEAWVITLRDRRGCGAYVKSSSGSSPAATTPNCGAGTPYLRYTAYRSFREDT